MCQQCEPGYVWGYDPTDDKLLMDICIPHDLGDNCLAKDLSKASDTASACDVCMKGSEF